MRRESVTYSVVTLTLLLFAGVASAQPKPGYLPSSTHLFPAGAQRGTSVDLLVGAECTPPGTELLFHGDGIAPSVRLDHEVADPGEPSPRRLPTVTPITYPREWAARMDVSHDVAPGVFYWRLHSAQGGTGSRPFVIGDLPEFIESESNSTWPQAELVSLPVTVNGRIHGERDQDCFRFFVPAGETISCEVMAGRLGSPLDPVVELLDVAGQPLAARQYHIGSDPVIVFRSESSAECILRISNVTFRGDPSFVYRINLRSHGGKPQDVPQGSAPSGAALNGQLSPEMAAFREVLASSLTLANLPHETVVPQFEAEPNGDAASATALQVPTTTDGWLSSADDRDLFRLAVTRGQELRVECKAWPPGTPTLPTIQILKDDGTSLSTVTLPSGDGLCARLSWKSGADQLVLLRVQDLRFGSRGGEEFTYRLRIEEDTPDFQLAIDSDSVVVTQGQDARVTVNVQRFGNWTAPIELTATGLPDGVTAEPVTAGPGKTNAALILKASENAGLLNAIVQVQGTATIDEKPITKTAQCHHLGIDSEGVAIGSPTTDRLSVSIQHKPLFRLFCSEAYLYAHRGSIFEYEMEVERLNGFDGEIHLQQGDRQNRDLDGVEIRNAIIPVGQTTTRLPIFLPESMAINVQSQSQLYSQAWAGFRDANGNPQAVLVLAEKRNMLRTMPTVVALAAADNELTAKPGDTVTCRFLLRRTSNFPGPMTLSLVSQNWAGSRPLPVSIAAGQTEAVVPVSIVPGNLENHKPVRLQFQATGRMPNGTVIITETSIELRAEDDSVTRHSAGPTAR